MSKRLMGIVVAMVSLAACEGEPPQRDPAGTALKVQLLERLRADQAVRDSVFGRGLQMDGPAVASMLRVDSANTTWLKAEIVRNGWPSPTRVGAAASNAAFLIVQHATHDPPFQRAMLDTIALAFEKGEIEGQSYALLFDRVRTQAGEKQRYGTQAKLKGNRVVFDPIEDSLKVDSLRATVKLSTLADYRRVLDSVYFGKAAKQ